MNKSTKQSKGWKIFLVVFLLIILGISLAPMGIFMFMQKIGLSGATVSGGDEMFAVTLFMIVSSFVGLFGVYSSDPRVFKYIFLIILTLVIVNISGCVILIDGLSINNG